MEAEFKEKQKFTQWWLWLFLIGLVIFQLYGLYQQLIKGVNFGNKPMLDIGLMVFTLIPFAILILFWLTKLETEVNQKGIRIRFRPFVKKSFKWEDIQSATVIKYKFVGYGIRLFTSYGTVYNIKGNTGLSIELKNGKKVLVGTQKGEEISQIVAKFLRS